MIKGYFLTKDPWMNEFKDIVTVLKSFNPAYTRGKPENIDLGTCKAIKKSFYSDRTYITSISSKKSSNLDGTYEIYSIIEEALPTFVSVFRYTKETILIVYPKFSMSKENDSYSLLIDELTRLATISMRSTDGNRDTTVEFIRTYVGMFVSSPESRLLDSLEEADNDDDEENDDYE